MEIKGSVLESIPLFIKSKFGEESYQTWLTSLPPESQNFFSQSIMLGSWYPAKEGLIIPTQKLCDVFYAGNVKGAWECGEFSAEYALKGIYKMFLQIGSAGFLIKRASALLPTFYKPCKLEMAELHDNDATVKLVEMGEPHVIIDQRIAGFIHKALVVTGKNPKVVEVKQSLAKGDPCSEFYFSWN